MSTSMEHTDKRYEEELKKLREEILYMGGLVEDQIQKAVKTSLTAIPLAQVIIERDHEVNRLDVEIDDICIKLLALHQPAGRDLRFITTGLKITTDLERIGDMAVNICERALELNQEPQLKPYIDIPRMARVSQRMIRESLDAFVREDTDLALKVCKDDDEVDQLNVQIFRETLSFMLENAQTISRATKIASVSKYWRIADPDHIAEMVIFMFKAKATSQNVLPPAVSASYCYQPDKDRRRRSDPIFAVVNYNHRKNALRCRSRGRLQRSRSFNAQSASGRLIDSARPLGSKWANSALSSENRHFRA